MLRLDRVIKSWKESGALNSQINLYGFWNDCTFITKSGDLGSILRVQGVDYESLDQAAQEYAVKRLEAALKIFGPGFHVYQYLFKTDRPTIPFQNYANSGNPLTNGPGLFTESRLSNFPDLQYEALDFSSTPIEIGRLFGHDLPMTGENLSCLILPSHACIGLSQLVQRFRKAPIQ